MAALRIGDRSRRPPLDLADPHRLRPHRLAAPPARRERTAAGDHQLPRRRDHGPGGAAAHGPGVPGQPGPDGRRGRPDADRGAAAGVRQPDHDRACATTGRASSSARTASAPCLDEVPECAEDLSDEALHQGQVFWATVDSSWLHKVDRAVFASELDRIRALEPTMVLSSHLPAGAGLVDWSGCWVRSPRSPTRRRSSDRTRPRSSRCWPGWRGRPPRPASRGRLSPCCRRPRGPHAP